MKDNASQALSTKQRIMKRLFDFLLSSIALLFTWWIILISFILASIDTRANGFFIQKRVGYKGQLFPLIKLRTMRINQSIKTTVTTKNDPRITALGRFWRKSKIDELPQLINVLFGHMSFVGPRPDVPGFADLLQGDDRKILYIKPGITGPATLKYRCEEDLLAAAEDPDEYNSQVIWPDKVKLNREYIDSYSISKDFKYIWQTIFS